MKDLKGQKFPIPKFKHNITEYLPEALSSIGLNKGGLIDDEYDKVILVLLDGFGHESMSNMGVLDQLAMEIHEFGSVVPSVTSSALSSIFTGKMPGEHGVIGTTFWMPQAGEQMSALGFSNAHHEPLDIDPSNLLLTETIPMQLKQDKIKMDVILSDDYQSGLTEAIHSGSNVHFVSELGGQFEALSKFLSSKNKIAFSYFINPDYHFHLGLSDDAIRCQLNAIFSMLRRLNKHPRAKKTCLILAGDHGGIRLSTNLDLEAYQHLFKATLRTGYRYSNLFTYKQTRAEAVGVLKDCWVFDGAKALKKGIFGKAHEESFKRIGDLSVFAQKDVCMTNGNMPLKGGHGSITPEEMSTAFAFGPLSEFNSEV